MSAPISSPAAAGGPQPRSKKKFLDHMKKAGTLLFRHVKHIGAGVICSVAYFDPGNWGVDLQAGSLYGYSLLFIVLLSGLIAVYLQVLASRLGCVTGLDLASHTRLLLYNRTKHPRLFRWLTLYPLYALAETAIIATDLAELLGSAIALVLLFPKLKLWQGLLLTVSDVIFILALGDPLAGEPVRMFEFLIAGMVLTIMVCMGVIIAKVEVLWGDAFKGFLPSKPIFTAPGSLYTAIGIIGATVMPHSLFLGSALATQDRIKHRMTEGDELACHEKDDKVSDDTPSISSSPSALSKFRESVANFFRTPPPSAYASEATRHSEHKTNSLSFVLAHIYHGSADMVTCLLGFAVLINSFILIMASAVFYYGSDDPGNNNNSPASLFDAYNLIHDMIGKPAAILFAVALLASGQSSSFIATIAGQAVSEGFIQWRVAPVVRRLLTRLLAVIPSMMVAIVVGANGINALLVVSQVILSVVLPFVTFPLLYCTSSKAIMRVRKDPVGNDSQGAGDVEDGNQWVYFNNNKVAVGIGIVIWLLVVTANVYVLLSLIFGFG